MQNKRKRCITINPEVLHVDPNHTIRIIAFLGILALMACWEVLAPRRPSRSHKMVRWITNLGLSAMNTLMIRMLFVSGAIGAAMIGEEEGWGLLNTTIWPGWVEFLIAIVLLDLVVYGQHVLFHRIPPLWRLHRVHHSDVEFDVTTGVRFHPVEIVVSMFIKIVAITELGASPSAVLIFEILLNATAMFNHSNVRLPMQVDSVLRWVVVTPDMHRVHHSVIQEETNSNFGFNLPWWDRAFGTYVAQPGLGHEHMVIGLEQFRNPAQLTWLGLLTLPFVKEPLGLPEGLASVGDHHAISAKAPNEASPGKKEKVLVS